MTRLILGDCLEAMRTLPAGSVDAIVTDPPYGHGDRWSGGTWADAPMYEDARRWDAEPVALDSLLAIVAIGKTACVWGGNYYALPPSRGWLSWVKSSRMETLADFELAWTSQDRPSKAYFGDRNPDGKREHPTQKPIDLMRWCLDALRIPVGATVCDPYMGSASTGVACVLTGRNFIGIEIDPSYFAIAQRRIAEAEAEVASRLPLEMPRRVEQLALMELAR